MERIKICEICGESYMASRSNQKYCPECGVHPGQARNRLKRALRINKMHSGEFDRPVERVCMECGKKILTPHHSPKFCNQRCRQAYAVKHARCLFCGKSLIKKDSVAEKGYCSEECQKKMRWTW